MGRNRKAARYGQLENVRLMMTCYPPHTHFRTLVAAGGRAGQGQRYIAMRCSVRNPDGLRLFVETLIQWAHQHADVVWLDDSLLDWVTVPPSAQAAK